MQTTPKFVSPNDSPRPVAKSTFFLHKFQPDLDAFIKSNGCSAQFQQRQPQQQRQRRFQTECQIQNLNAVEPKHRFKSEAGVTEFWDQNEEQFQCAGVAALRHKIQPRGLLLPSFNNAPQLVYVVQGRGIQGAVFPGCPETYQSGSQQSRSQRDRQQGSNDQHQKIRQIKEGDVLALPAGVPHWIYNNGDSHLVLVSLVDVANADNQLDLNFRKFFLAGNPQEELVRGGRRQSQSRDRTQSRSHKGQEEEQEESNGNNILNGFDNQILQEVFGINSKLVKKLQNHNDNRGAIVKAQRDFQVVSPQSEEEEEEQEGEEQERERRRRGNPNGLEETFCSMKLRHQIDNPSFADIFNPRAGRITTVNSYNLPILQFLQLSAEKGVLYRNAFYAPHWNVNAHSIVYITRGNGRVQVVRENGETVFDDQVEEGQMFVVPQNFAVLKKAGNQGLEWIAFKTDANAMINQIGGRVSAFRSMPLDVLASSYRISREEARRLKESRQEMSVFSPGSSSQHQSA
ncbi:hypothetical protein DITRI_Ditri15bG0099500 [Diplodiscus trichospermus]